jgi:stage III sporulation protein SpoIIIAA
MLVTDDMDRMLAVMPSRVLAALQRVPPRTDLMELVLDVGRPLTLHYPDEKVICHYVITPEDLTHIVEQIGVFGDDDRAGISESLHRISCLRNRRGEIIGLTCRVGRVLTGIADSIRDLIATGESLLLLGRPGVGKSSRLREVSRLLADDYGKRVIVVDTSGEIAGVGDLPHMAIGSARRMHVPRVVQQAIFMQRAVENHTPQVVIVDEIGNESEAKAARSISERGVQLVATAHGNTMEDLLRNVALNDLLGGIASVTLGDAEARRRGTQKSVIERKMPPTFSILVEIVDRNTMVVYRDVQAAVDALLREKTPTKETRAIAQDGTVRTVVTRGDDADDESAPEAPTALAGATLYVYGLGPDLVAEAIRDARLTCRIVVSPKEASHLIVRSKLIDRVDFDVEAHVKRGLRIIPVRANRSEQIIHALKSAR